MRYFDVTADIVAILIIPISFIYLIRNMKVIFNHSGDQMDNNNVLFISVLMLVLMHYVLAMYNVLFVTPSGNDVDNFVFWANGYSTGLKEYEFQIGAEFFKQFLSFFYYIFGSSSLLLANITTVIFISSLLTLLKLCFFLKIKIESSVFIFLFGGMPFFLLISIEPYREMFLIFFMISSLYYGLRFRESLKLRYAIYSILFILLFGLIHWVTAALSLIIFTLIFFFPVNEEEKINFKISIFFTYTFFAFILIIIAYAATKYSLISYISLFNIDYIEAVELHNQKLLAVPGSLNYSVNFNSTSFFDLILWTLKSFIFYMFKPFIWEINSFSSLIVSIEGVVRFLLFIYSIIFIYKSHNKKRYALLMLIYLIVEFSWSLGTSNAGTAARHHLVSYWILVILGGGGLIEAIKKNIGMILGKRAINNM